MSRRSVLAAVALSTALSTGLAAQETTVTAATGESVRLIVGGPEGAEAGLLLVHDWFGITPFSYRMVERFAGQGYRVVAVDLYQGRSATDHPAAGELMAALGERDPAEVDALIDAGLQYLGDRKVAVIGYSMGGDWAFNTQLRHPDRISTAVVVYGGGMDSRPDSALARLNGPVLFVTGSRDSWALDTALDLLPRLDSVAHGAELLVYPGARHAYAQPLFAAGANLDEEATRVSWLVVDDFLQRHLRSHD